MPANASTHSTPESRPTTHVAVGVLIRPDGAVLLADRPVGKPYAGYWEFPGGKVEPGESVEAALARELHEELGVDIHGSEPWTVIEHDYPHAYVRLYFRRVFSWDGTPHSREGQRLRFHRPEAPPPLPLLPAAVPTLRWVQLGAVLVRSPGNLADAAAVARWVDDRLARGARWMWLHEPALFSAPSSAEPAAALAPRSSRGSPGDSPGAMLADPVFCLAVAQARDYGARLLVDAVAGAMGGVDPVADRSGGTYWDSQALRSGLPPPVAAAWRGAGVRDRADLDRAAAAGCDFAVMENEPGSVQGREPGREPYWDAIAGLCRESPLPVYVPLPPSAAALARVRSLGAQGLVWAD